MKSSQNNIRDSLWEEKEHPEIWVRLVAGEALMARERIGAYEQVTYRRTNFSINHWLPEQLLLLWVSMQAEGEIDGLKFA